MGYVRDVIFFAGLACFVAGGFVFHMGAGIAAAGLVLVAVASLWERAAPSGGETP